jgi:hypothetical protein
VSSYEEEIFRMSLPPGKTKDWNQLMRKAIFHQVETSSIGSSACDCEIGEDEPGIPVGRCSKASRIFEMEQLQHWEDHVCDSECTEMNNRDGNVHVCRKSKPIPIPCRKCKAHR